MFEGTFKEPLRRGRCTTRCRRRSEPNCSSPTRLTRWRRSKASERCGTAAAAIQDAVLDNLDRMAERYASAVEGGQRPACISPAMPKKGTIILDICKKADAKTICRASRWSREEIGLNEELEAAGYKVVETDLGEYIIQLAQ